MSLKEFKSVKVDNKYPTSSTIIRCPFKSCHTRIIPLSSMLQSMEVNIKNSPAMVKISESDLCNTFFKINDVWDFDNIGVSKPTNTLEEPIIKANNEILKFKIDRILICSECDKGPIGFAGFQDEESDIKKLKYFLSCESVLYDIKDSDKENK